MLLLPSPRHQLAAMFAVVHACPVAVLPVSAQQAGDMGRLSQDTAIKCLQGVAI